MAIIFQYIVERHGKTLLPQYLGMYRLTVDGVEHYVVAIRNVFSNHLTTHKKFDLKGSTVDREASDKEKEKDLPTYKDNDFVKEGMKIYIGEEAKAKLIETLSADVDVSFMQILSYVGENVGINIAPKFMTELVGKMVEVIYFF